MVFHTASLPLADASWEAKRPPFICPNSCNDITKSTIRLNLIAGSERQKSLYLNTLSGSLTEAISLHTQAAPNDSKALHLALTTLLRRKGRVLDATADSIALLRRRASPQNQILLDQWKSINEQIARLSLSGSQPIPLPQYRQRIDDLIGQKEKVESEISLHSAEFRTQLQPITLEAVQLSLPTDAALVEFAAFRPFTSSILKPEEMSIKERYIAYILKPKGHPSWVELGDKQTIDLAIEKLRQALRDKNRKDVKQLARAVDENVMQPVRALLGKTRRVLIAADGTLNLVPFAALVDEKGHYLVQHYEFSYLTSGRDLLRLQVNQPNKQTSMVVANPDFGDDVKDGKAQERILKYRPSANAETGAGGVLSEYYFPPLGGTAQEAQALKIMMADATVLTEAQATEAVLKQASSPHILHVATHGFFLEDQKPAT